MKKYPTNYFSEIAKFFGIIFFVLMIYTVWQRQNPFIKYEVAQIIDDENSAVSDGQAPKVIGLKIESSEISVPVTLTNIENNNWKILSDSVAMLSNSNEVESESIILYGHNWKPLLGNLKKVSVGDSIMLDYSNGTQKEFVATGLSVVKSNNLLSLKSDDLVIYTCAGFLDRDRLIVSAQEI